MGTLDAAKEAARQGVRLDSRFIRDAYRSGNETWIRTAERARLKMANAIGAVFSGVRP